MFDHFSAEDYRRILRVDLEIGYALDDNEDKMDFINKLPESCKSDLYESLV